MARDDGLEIPIEGHSIKIFIPDDCLSQNGYVKIGENQPKPIPKEHILLLWEYVNQIMEWLEKRQYLGGGSEALASFTAMTPQVGAVISGMIAENRDQFNG